MVRARGIGLAVGALVLVAAAGCGGDEKAGGQALVQGNEDPDSVVAPSRPAYLAGPAIEYTDSNGFRYAIAMYKTASVVDQGNGTVAPPGHIFPGFAGELTNLQTDRPAPLPSWMTDRFFITGPVIGAPEAALKKSVPAGSCNTGTGFCDLGPVVKYVCSGEDPEGQSVTSSNATIAPGAKLVVGCLATTAGKMTENDIVVRLGDQRFQIPKK
jgi:hypothetical protein